MAHRSWWAAAGVAVAVLLTVGTGVVMTSGDQPPGRDDGGAGSPAGASGEPAARPPARPGPSTRPGPAVVAPRDQPERPDVPVTLTIESYEVLAPDRLRVRYSAGMPACYGALDRAVVKEGDQEVALVLVVRPPTKPPDGPCPDIALLEDTVVRLDAPLGDRRVVDGVSGRVVRRGHPEPDTDLY